MADINLRDFQKRLGRIERDHRALSSGYIRLEERNGLLVPVKKVRTRRGLPWRGLFLVLVAFVLFKSVLFAALGPVTYVERHAKLEAGSFVEQMGAFALRPDAATVYLGEKVTPLIGFFESIGMGR